MNNTNTSNEIEIPTFVILKCLRLPQAYRNISVGWEDICHDRDLKYVISYQNTKVKKWVVKSRYSMEYCTSCKSLASAIRYIENIYA